MIGNQSRDRKSGGSTMREIKFRGRRGHGNWYYGDLSRTSHTEQFIGQRSTVWTEIEADTVGQYTGMKDSHGKEIYEGDIVVVGQDTGNKYDRYIMTFNDDSHSYLAKQQGTLGSYIGSGYWNDKLVVIGNRWDNPELLGGAHDEY